MVRTGSAARERAPCICIRQLESTLTTVLAPVRTMESILVPAMPPEISGNLTENVPPKPQHSSAASVLDAEFAQRVTTVVIRNHVLQPRAHVIHARHLQHKLRKLPHSRRQRIGGPQRFRVPRE